MDIYVQSRGFAQDEDYRWLKINQGESPQLQLPPISPEVGSLIDNETPSVVLERFSDGRLLLLIAGIEPEKRRDFLDRQIRISVAWVGDNSDEPLLRHLAIRALQEPDQIDYNLTSDNSLAAEIDKTISLGGEYGFAVSPLLMQQLVERVRSEFLLSDKPPNPIKKIGPNLPKLKNQLAEELQKYHLPIETGQLVIVTGIKKRETLLAYGVWRSLSNLVDGEDWIEIPEKYWFFIGKLPEGRDLKNPVMWLILFVAIMSYMLSFLFALISRSNKANPRSNKNL